MKYILLFVMWLLFGVVILTNLPDAYLFGSLLITVLAAIIYWLVYGFFWVVILSLILNKNEQ